MYISDSMCDYYNLIYIMYTVTLLYDSSNKYSTVCYSQKIWLSIQKIYNMHNSDPTSSIYLWN